MENKIIGKVLQILPTETIKGKEKDHTKSGLIIETESKYPRKVCVQVWNGLIDKMPSVGSSVTASVEIESREYNQRWYTEVKAWKIEAQGQAQAPAQDDFPVKTEHSSATPPIQENAAGIMQDSEDLPF